MNWKFETNGIEGALESAGGDQTSPASVVRMFFSVRGEAVPDPIPHQLVAKAADLLAQGVTSQQFADVFKASQYGFLSGDNKSGWRATLGWLLEPDNFRKVQSGQYGSGTPAARMSMGTAGLGELERQAIAQMLREQEEEGNSV